MVFDSKAIISAVAVIETKMIEKKIKLLIVVLITQSE